MKRQWCKSIRTSLESIRIGGEFLQIGGRDQTCGLGGGWQGAFIGSDAREERDAPINLMFVTGPARAPFSV